MCELKLKGHLNSSVLNGTGNLLFFEPLNLYLLIYSSLERWQMYLIIPFLQVETTVCGVKTGVERQNKFGLWISSSEVKMEAEWAMDWMAGIFHS